MHKGNPDRIIIATALHHSATLVNSDKLSQSWDGPIKNSDVRE